MSINATAKTMVFENLFFTSNLILPHLISEFDFLFYYYQFIRHQYSNVYTQIISQKFD